MQPSPEMMMELHERLGLSDVEIVRVPGGWIYHFDMAAVFVPEPVE